MGRNYSAVTAACLLTKRDLFQEVGGFDEERLPVIFNDVDLCLKMRQAGYLIVYTPFRQVNSRGIGHASSERRATGSGDPA
jgi:GT2 family glycosyltransferase